MKGVRRVIEFFIWGIYKYIIVLKKDLNFKYGNKVFFYFIFNLIRYGGVF